SARLTDMAKPMVPVDHPNSRCSGSTSAPGVDRNPAAPTSATKPMPAIIHGHTTCLLRITRQACSMRHVSGSGSKAILCKNRAMNRPHQVAVLALDEVVAFDLGMPTQVFHAALDQQERRLYRVRVCTPGGRPVRSSAGFTVTPEHGLELLAEADTVLVAGVHYSTPVMTDGTLDEPVRDAPRAAAPSGP